MHFLRQDGSSANPRQRTPRLAANCLARPRKLLAGRPLDVAAALLLSALWSATFDDASARPAALTWVGYTQEGDFDIAGALLTTDDLGEGWSCDPPNLDSPPTASVACRSDDPLRSLICLAAANADGIFNPANLLEASFTANEDDAVFARSIDGPLVGDAASWGVMEVRSEEDDAGLVVVYFRAASFIAGVWLSGDVGSVSPADVAPLARIMADRLSRLVLSSAPLSIQ